MVSEQSRSDPTRDGRAGFAVTKQLAEAGLDPALVQDLHVAIVNAATSDVLRDLIIDPDATTNAPGARPAP
jgi:hypothetical protein